MVRSLCTLWEAFRNKNLRIQTCLRAWYQVRFFGLIFGLIFGHSWGNGEGPGWHLVRYLCETRKALHERHVWKTLKSQPRKISSRDGCFLLKYPPPASENGLGQRLMLTELQNCTADKLLCCRSVSPQNFYKLIFLPFFFCCIFFCNFYGNSLGPPIFVCKKKQQSESTDITRPMWCFFVSLGVGGWKILFVIFYEINSSQDVFVLQKFWY